MLGYTRRLEAGDNVHQMENLVSTLQQRVTNYDIEIQQLQILCWQLEFENSNMLAAAA